MTRRILKTIPLAAVLSLAACLPAPAVADVIYTQASDFPADGFEYSQYDPTTTSFTAQVFDNLPLGTAGTATGLSWEGGYPTANGMNVPSMGMITGFKIGFYADSGGLPGALLQSEDISGDAGETFRGIDIHGQYTYDYTAALPTAFTLLAGTAYWISIAAILPAATQSWGWHTSVAGDMMAYSTTISGFVPNDVAFTLTSTAVPEANSLALVGLGGFAALAFARLRRPADR